MTAGLRRRNYNQSRQTYLVIPRTFKMIPSDPILVMIQDQYPTLTETIWVPSGFLANNWLYQPDSLRPDVLVQTCIDSNIIGSHLFFGKLFSKLGHLSKKNRAIWHSRFSNRLRYLFFFEKQA